MPARIFRCPCSSKDSIDFGSDEFPPGLRQDERLILKERRFDQARVLRRRAEEGTAPQNVSLCELVLLVSRCCRVEFEIRARSCGNTTSLINRRTLSTRPGLTSQVKESALLFDCSHIGCDEGRAVCIGVIQQLVEEAPLLLELSESANVVLCTLKLYRVDDHFGRKGFTVPRKDCSKLNQEDAQVRSSVSLCKTWFRRLPPKLPNGATYQSRLRKVTILKAVPICNVGQGSERTRHSFRRRSRRPSV